MKMIMVFLALFSISALGGSVGLEEAQKRSAQDGKPVLIDFYAVWCGPCKRFTADSKKNKEIKALLEGVHLVKLDAEKGGREIADKFNVKGYPTFVLADKDLKPMKRWWGYDRESFSKDLKAGLADPITLEARTARFNKKETLKDATVLAQSLESSSKPAEALKFYEAAERLNDQDTSHFYGFDVFRMKHQLYAEKGVGAFEGLDQKARALLKSGKLTDNQPLYMSSIMFREARSAKNMDAVAHYINAVLENAPKDDPTRLEYKALKLVYIDKDIPAAVKLANTFFGENWKEDASKLNQFSWWCFENNVNLEEARDLAAKAVSLVEPGSDRANILDTQAELENAMGYPMKAFKLMEQAVQDDPRKSHKKQLERFRKLAEKDGGASGN